MKDTIDSTIYSEVPLLDRLQRITGVILGLLFANNISRFLWDIAYFIIISIVFTRELRLLTNSTLISILIFLILAIIFVVWSYLIYKYMFPLCTRLIFGPPVFGKLGGLSRKTFFTILKCADAIDFEFRPADLDRVKLWCTLNREVIEQSLKHSYHTVLRNESSTPEEPADFLKKWSDIWQEKILKIGTKNAAGDTVTFDDHLTENNFASIVEPVKLQGVTTLISPTFLAFQVVMMIFITKYLSNQINLVTVIQVGLFSSLVISLLLFNFHAHQNSEVAVLGVMAALPEEVSKSLGDRIKSLGEQPFKPLKVKIKKHYLSLVRDYFALILFWFGGVLNAISSLLFIGIIVVIGFILRPANMSNILPWYKNMAIGLALIPFGMLTGYYVAFLTLQYARVLLAPIIVGVLAVVLPYALGYLFTGKIDLTQVQNSVWAAGAGIVASLVTVITAQVKSTLEGEKDE